MIVGDFNMTCTHANENTPNFDAASADAFNAVIEDFVLQELPLPDTHYTWSKIIDEPTLVRLDRASSTNMLGVFPSSTPPCTCCKGNLQVHVGNS